MGVSQTFSGGEKRRLEKRVRSQATETAHGANYCGPSSVPPPMRDRPPQRGLRPPLLRMHESFGTRTSTEHLNMKKWTYF